MHKNNKVAFFFKFIYFDHFQGFKNRLFDFIQEFYKLNYNKFYYCIN
jgi:hypothetical protein